MVIGYGLYVSISFGLRSHTQHKEVFNYPSLSCDDVVINSGAQELHDFFRCCHNTFETFF